MRLFFGRWSATYVVGWAWLLIAASCLRAEETAWFDPAGIRGGLVLSGSEVPDEAWTAMLQWADCRDARLLVLQSGGGELPTRWTARLLESWHARQAASLQILRINSADDLSEPRVRQALGQATGVWLAAGDESSARMLLAAESLGQDLRAVVDRGGVVGAAGAAVPLLSAALAGAETDDAVAVQGFGLLPESLIALASAEDSDADPLAAAWDAHPALIGYSIAANAALLVRGRQMVAVGEGDVWIHLPASKHWPDRERRLEGTQRQADLTALRRAARLRVAGDFPPGEPRPPELKQGTAIAIGGGGMPEGILRRFVDLAGGAEASIVVLPTANPDPLPRRDRFADLLREMGAGKVTVLSERTRDVVEGEEYLAALRAATGIWFGGGRQWRFVDAYLHTKALPLMHDVLARGGVVMGSSAGASIQAEYLARGNPLGNLDIMAEGYEQGLSFLPGIAIDQHFAQRQRFADMSSLVKKYPQLLGIGIDEATALVVQGRIGEVTGRGAVHFFDAGKPVAEGQSGYESVPSGGRYDLVDRRVLAGNGAESK